MDPDTYTRLYGPGRSASHRRGSGVALVAGVLWAVSLLLLGCLGFLAMWAEADRGPTEGIQLRWVLTCLATQPYRSACSARRWSVACLSRPACSSPASRCV